MFTLEESAHLSRLLRFMGWAATGIAIALAAYVFLF